MSIKKNLALASLALIGSSFAQSINNNNTNTAYTAFLDNSGQSFNKLNFLNKKPLAKLVDNSWRIDLSVLNYTETDRLSVVSPAIAFSKTFDADSTLRGRLVYDTITGASANGASASTSPQTFTPATVSAYSVPANTTPLYAYDDERTIFSLEWEAPPFIEGGDDRGVYSAFSSYEQDYLSVGFGANFIFHYPQEQTKLTAGVAFTRDEITPNYTPEGLANAAIRDNSRINAYSTKSEVDAIIGFTKTFSQHSLVQLRYSIGDSSGYLTNPYKIFSVINGTTGNTLGYQYENRPERRLRQNFYASWNYKFDSDSFSAYYHYFWDDWSIQKHTIDFRYQLYLSDGFYVQPHLSYSQQSEAYFYRHSFVTGTLKAGDFASADYRLGGLTTATIGVKIGLEFSKYHQLSLRYEQATQTGDSSPSNAIGSQKNVDLFPTITATIVQANYSFSF